MQSSYSTTARRRWQRICAYGVGPSGGGTPIGDGGGGGDGGAGGVAADGGGGGIDNVTSSAYGVGGSF